MILYSVAFPSIVRGKYQETVQEDLTQEFKEKHKVYCDYYIDLDVAGCHSAWVVSGFTTSQDAEAAIEQIRNYFIDMKNIFQLEDDEIQSIINYK
jgi:hypothetical protein